MTKKSCIGILIAILCMCALSFSAGAEGGDSLILSPLLTENPDGFCEILLDDEICTELPAGLSEDGSCLKSDKTLKDNKLEVNYYPNTSEALYEVFVYQPSVGALNIANMEIVVDYLGGSESFAYSLKEGSVGYYSLGVFPFSEDPAEKITIRKPAGTHQIFQYGYYGDVKLVRTIVKEKTGVVVLDDDNANNNEEEVGRVQILGNVTKTQNSDAYNGRYTAAANKQAITVNYYPRLEEGKYSVYTYKKWFAWGNIDWSINGGALSGYLNTDMRTVELHGGWYYLGDADFTGEYGTDIVSFSRSGGREGLGCADAVLFIPKKNVKLLTFTYNDAAETDPNALPPSADLLNIEFNYVLSDLSDDTVSVRASDGKEIACECIQDGSNVVRLNLKESLSANTEYTVEMSIYDVLKKGDDRFTLSFMTDESEETQAAAVELGEVTYRNRRLIVEGVVKNSSGTGIKGRNVTLSLTSPGDLSYPDIVSGVSGENGAFSLETAVSDYEEDGAYRILLCGAYCAEPATGRFLYMTRETESAFLRDIAATETESDVQNVLLSEKYNTLLKPESYSNLGDKNAFLRHFVGGIYPDLDAFKDEYTKMLLFEKMNQAINTATVSDILSDEGRCAQLGLRYGILELLENTKSEFLDAVIRIEKVETLEEFIEEYNKIVNEYLLKEAGITEIGNHFESLRVNYGQAAEMKLCFSPKEQNVKEITLSLKADRKVFDNLYVECPLKKARVEKKLTSSEAEIRILFDAAGNNLSDVLTVGFTPSAFGVGKVSVETAGSVRYAFSENSAFEMTADIEKKTVEITSKSASQTGSSGGSSGGGSHSAPTVSGGGTSSRTGGVTPTDAPTDAPIDQTVFTDISSVEWAKEYILSLYEKGIVSRPENGMFEPEREITRSEFAKMLVLAADAYDASLESDFLDSDKDKWFDSYIASAKKSGIVIGRPDGSFGVTDSITREDAAVMLLRAFSAKGVSLEFAELTYADRDTISDYAQEAVGKLTRAGIMNGVGDDLFSPKGNLTRAMAAKIIELFIRSTE